MRQRTAQSSSSDASNTANLDKSSAKTSSKTQSKSASRVTVLDVVRVLGGLLLLNSLLSYYITKDAFFWNRRPWFTKPAQLSNYFNGPRMFTDRELALYNGSDPALPIYIALNATVYDVTAGRRVYGPGGSYSVFSGKDATRAFITGCFIEDGHPDIRGAEWTYVPAEIPHFDQPTTPELKSKREQALRQARKQVLKTVQGWQRVFSGETGKDYFAVGYVVRPVGWQDKIKPPKLCKQAEDARPKAKEDGQDAGAKYRGGH